MAKGGGSAKQVGTNYENRQSFTHDGVAFEDLPEDWKCPRCKKPKDKFNKA